MSQEHTADKCKTYFCLGNGERGCDGCGIERNWQELNKLPDEFRKRLQAEMQRVDDTECILRGRPWFVQTTNNIPTGISAYRDKNGDLVSTYPNGQKRVFEHSSSAKGGAA